MYSDINVPVARLYGVETDTDDERELQRQLFGGLAGRLWTVDNLDHLKSEQRNQHERSTQTSVLPSVGGVVQWLVSFVA